MGDVRGALATTVGVTPEADRLSSHYRLTVWRVQSADEFAILYRDHILLSLK